MERVDTRAIWEANAPAWIELSRAGFDVYRDVVNTPAFLRMLPSVDGLRCLDLGCGEGHNTRLLAELGAEVAAVDISELFVRAAADLPVRGVDYVIGDGAALPFAAHSFDAVTAFMSLMNVADPEHTLREIARVLRPGGFIQFSIGHPLTTSPEREWAHDEAGRRCGLTVGDYFYEGPVSDSWTFGAAPSEIRDSVRPFEITFARRTMAGWLNMLLAAGFSLTALDEPRADESTARTYPEVADTRIVPYFLLVRAQRI